MVSDGHMTSDDQNRAAVLDQARDVVKAAGADGLARRPWQHPKQPASDTDLLRFAAWVARDADVDPELLAAGMRLLGAARAELDQTEAGLLFAARSTGMTWPQIADALDLGSAQAAQQRMNRVLARLGEG
jgi:hypothetical protein